jgi:cation diffusion facilitator family transporter
MNQNLHKKYGYLEGWVSVVGNTILFALKITAGMLTGSIALMADAWHTLSDSASSLVVLISVKLSNKPPDRDHPYGHGRYDLIASIIIGVLLAVVAFDFGKESILKLSNRESTNFTIIAWIAVISSIVLKEAMAQFALYTYRKSNNASLKADAWHHRSDALSSVLILIGLIFNKYAWWIDGVLGILVALFIVIVAYQIMASAIKKILGEQPNDNTIKHISDLAIQAAGFDIEPHRIRLHDYGHTAELTMHIYLDNQLRLFEINTIISRISKQIESEYGYTVIVHADPLKIQE